MATFQLLRFAAPRTAAGRVLSWAPGAPAPPAPRGAEQSASPRSPKRPRNAPRARGARAALPVRRVPVSSAATSSSRLVHDSEMRGVTIRLHLPHSRLPGRPHPARWLYPATTHDRRLMSAARTPLPRSGSVHPVASLTGPPGRPTNASPPSMFALSGRLVFPTGAAPSALLCYVMACPGWPAA